MNRVTSTLIGLALLAALAGAPLSAAAATSNRATRVGIVSADDRDSHAAVFAVSGEMLVGGILLMAGSAYALRRSRR